MSFAPKPTSPKLGSSFVNSGRSFSGGSLGIGSLNKLSASSFDGRTQDPHKINFTAEGNGWRKGETEKWYKAQPSTRFESLEYRKERESPFYHEYILVDLGNNTICRFDRRGDINNRANVLVGEPIPSEDTAHVIAKNDKKFYPAIESGSDLLLRMNFPKGQDILTILAICFGIQSTKATQAYSLTRYNCYFFSWMVITATARVTVDWAALAQETSLWEALVASAMTGLGRDEDESGPLANPKAAVTVTLGAKNKGDSSLPTQFTGSAYFATALRNALVETRAQIRKSLAELILHSTVDKAMHEVSEISAQKAGSQAARSHACQAANDAAMEAVIETMWRDIISDSEGGKLWEKKCQLAKACVEASSAAAADAAGQRIILPPAEPSTPASDQDQNQDQDQAPAPSPSPAPSSALALALESDSAPPIPAADGAEIPAPPAKWEVAWVTVWEERWTQENDSSADSSKTSISDRAKAAWIKAWDEACKANERYVPLISHGVAEYVTKNLPEALPEVLQYGTETSTIKNMVKGLMPSKFEGSSNFKLQEWVKARILEHCQRVIRMTAGAQQPSRLEFEETMRGVWESTVRCLFDKPTIETENKA